MKNLLIRFGREPKEAFREAIRFTTGVLLICFLAKLSQMFQLSIFIVSALYTALTYRNGILFAIGSIVVSSVILFSLSAGGDIVVAMGSIGVVVGELYYRKRNMMTAIMTAAVMVVLGHVLVIRIANEQLGMDVIEYQFNRIAKTMQEQTGVSDMINYNIEQAKSMMRLLLPSILVTIGLGVGVLNYFFAGSIVDRMDPSKQDFKSFGEFRMPGSALMAALITFAGIYLVSRLMGYEWDTLYYNLAVIYSFLFTLQGLAVIDRMILKSRRSLVRSLVLVTMVFSVFLYPFFVTMGALDSIFNIRKLPR
ncbi:MAG: DUF2232 domain-containing protein [Peptostreptococcaceae bacterium]|nr:DUF2232 domain-containing protein [Peptostreptococcaceae bacterium]